MNGELTRGIFEDVEGFSLKTLVTVHPCCHRQSCLNLRKVPSKFCVDIFIRRLSRMILFNNKEDFSDLEYCALPKLRFGLRFRFRC